MPSIQRFHWAWCLTAAFSACLSAGAAAQSVVDSAVEEQRRAVERETQQRHRLEPRPDVRLQVPDPAPPRVLPKDETPCFPIDSLQLDGELHERLAWLLGHADGHSQLAAPDTVVGRCLGAGGIQVVIDRLQHALVARGYATSRVLAGAQDLHSGTLVLTVVPGRVGDIRFADGTGQRASRWNTVPAQTGDVLNLRDIEQALENYERAPTAQTRIRIEPGGEGGSSDLVIEHRQSTPFRASATVDDSGTHSTGKYQGSFTLSYDNWWNLSDLFYLTLLHDLGGSDPGARGTRGHIVHYGVPAGYWLLGFTHSASQFHQTVAGANQDYVYSGRSRQTEIKLSRILARDQVSKTGASIKTFRRASDNFIDDAPVQVQRRLVGALEWGLDHRRVAPQGSFQTSAAYRLGTGAWGSLPAPEESFGEGTSRMRMWLIDAGMQHGFALGDRRWTHSANWRAQYHRTPLTPQDRFAIGGRYSVRGFDGRSVLVAERGWLLRNEIATAIGAGDHLFLGVDRGHVGGPSASTLVGTQLTGAVIGVRGRWSQLQYDAFLGTPLSRPAQFRTAKASAGFSVAWSH